MGEEGNGRLLVLPNSLSTCLSWKKSKPKDEAAIRKKTDAPSPDDPKAKEEQEREEKAEAAKKAAGVDDGKKDDEPSPEDTGEPPEVSQHASCGFTTTYIHMYVCEPFAERYLCSLTFH